MSLGICPQVNKTKTRAYGAVLITIKKVTVSLGKGHKLRSIMLSKKALL